MKLHPIRSLTQMLGGGSAAEQPQQATAPAQRGNAPNKDPALADVSEYGHRIHQLAGDWGGGSTQSTLWRKLAQFDVNHDGKLSFSETLNVFKRAGFPPAWAFVSALATAPYRGPIGRGEVSASDFIHPSRLFTISLPDIQKSILPAQSGVWDPKTGSSNRTKAEAFIRSVDTDPASDNGTDGTGGRITLASIRKHVEADAKASVAGKNRLERSLLRKERFAASYSAWVQLMEVAGHHDPQGPTYLTSDQVRCVFNGHLFDMILAGMPREERVSIPRILSQMVRFSAIA